VGQLTLPSSNLAAAAVGTILTILIPVAIVIAIYRRKRRTD
jgi:hypothetical protein